MAWDIETCCNFDGSVYVHSSTHMFRIGKMKKRMAEISGLRQGRLKLKDQQLPFAMKGQLMVYCLLTITALETNGVDGASKLKVPCYFVFGDSQADNGNNNFVHGNARADYKPYGIDFSKQMIPTGRFTNGRNVPDFIAKFLGFNHYIPPFRNITKGWKIFEGVNYASGGSGILHETGRLLGQISGMNKQLENHNYTISKIHGLLGRKSATTKHLERCLYTIQIGSNDYLNNYFMPHLYKTSFQSTPQGFAVILNKKLSQQLKNLYKQGARKVAIFGAGSIGCTPYARDSFKHKGSPCVDKINSAIQLFNIGLKSLVDQLNIHLAGAKFIFIDVFKISTIKPSNYGQMVLDAPCCEVQPRQMQCVPFGKVCANRTQYMFWDGVHPTEIGFMVVANRAFKAQEPGDAYPYDISHLVRL